MCSWRQSLRAVCGGLLAARSLMAVEAGPLENAYWRFEEGQAGQRVGLSGDEGAVHDITGNNNGMRCEDAQAAPAYTEDVPSAVVPATGLTNCLAIRFDGSPQRLYTSGRDINNCLTTAFTLEASFKADAVGNDLWQCLVVRESSPEDPSSEGPLLSLKIRGDDGRLMVQVRDASNSLRDVKSVAPIAAEQWYHAAATATAAELKLYLDAGDGQGYILQGSTSLEGGGPLYQGWSGADYDAPWTLGRGWWARLPMEWFSGVLDEVRLTNEALKPAGFLWAKPIPGDFDGDTDVDGDDLSILQACLTGPDRPYAAASPEGCTLPVDAQGFLAADFDRDHDVDQADFGLWQRCLSRTGVPPSADCAG